MWFLKEFVKVFLVVCFSRFKVLLFFVILVFIDFVIFVKNNGLFLYFGGFVLIEFNMLFSVYSFK